MTASHLAFLAAALLYSSGGVGIKSCALPGWQIAGFRSAIAALTLFAIVPEARRVSWRTLLVALGYASTFLTFVVANTKTTAAHAVFLQATAPLYLVVLAPVVLGERPRRRDLLLIALIGIGMWLLFLGRPADARALPDLARGNQIAAFGGLSWALTLLGLRWLSRESAHAAPAAAAWGNVLAAGLALPMAWPLVSGTATDWLVVIFLGVAQVGVANYLVTRGLARTPALTASLLLMLEPALNPVWTWLLLRESPGAATIAGGAIVLIATIVNTLLERRASVSAPTSPSPDSRAARVPSDAYR